MMHAGLADLKRVIQVKQQSASGLIDDLLWHVSSRADSVRKHLSIAMNAFTGHLAARNMEAIHALQRWMFWFTLVVTLATVVGIAFEPRDVRAWAAWMYSALKQLGR
jgi:hypothetical protein